MTAERYRWIICDRVSDNPGPVAGSRQRPCWHCQIPVWVAPSSLRHLADGARAICAEHVPPDEYAAAYMRGPNAEQRRELGRP